MDLIESLANRRVTFRYRRTEFTFALSQALFSSAQVDAGTSMLLAMIAQAGIDYSAVADLGCGTGTLGIALAGAAGVPLQASDRDALAVEFTRYNAERNAVDLQACIATVRGVAELEPARAEGEIVVANLPAKAGEPVLDMLADQMISRATVARGWIAYVLVKPLEELADRIASRAGTVVARRANANHVCYLIRAKGVPAPMPELEALPSAYLRTTTDFTGPRTAYTARTVHSLPEFDGLSYRTALAFDLLTGRTFRSPWMLYGAGQGHLAIGLCQAAKDPGGCVADRDALAVEISRENALRIAGVGLETLTVPWIPVDAPDDRRFELVVINDDPVSGTPWSERVLTATERLVVSQGWLLLVSRATSVSRFEKDARKKLRLEDDRRMRGFRAALYRRRD